ncbi:MAG: DUF1887 family protein [Chloroflexia bacterium]|nr:DUF1887 family protein [Chloroflexia bacterium]
MPKRILISLVSEYTIPNIQLIKEFEHQTDVFLFITSEKMEEENENRTDWIIHSVQLAKEKTKRIVINPHNLSDIEAIFEKAAFNKEDEYHINLTCGTKLMALVTLNFFSGFKKVHFYYVSQEVSHYQLVYPKEKRSEINFKYRITLFEYLSAYGLKIESKEYLHKPVKETKKLMQKVLFNEGNIRKLPEIRNAKSYKRSEDKKYFSGGWFEEYVFNTIKTHFELKDKEIGMGVRLQNQRTENEYDVVFVKDNQIYVLECKAYFGYSKLKAKN